MTTMNAIQIHSFGTPDVLTYETVQRPTPQHGEVLIRIRAAGVNPIDIVSRTFPLPITTGTKPLPYILGWDLSGEIVALGPDVTQFSIGDEVYGLSRFPNEAAAYSEYATALISDITLKPRNISHHEAAGIPLAALTAWQSLFDIAHLQSGQTILITGGSGGVGHFAIQLAKWQGAHVITTTSTRNIDFVRSLGADTIIDYTQQTLSDALPSTPNVDIVLDTVGEDVFTSTFPFLKRGGLIATTASHKINQDQATQLATQAGVTLELPFVHPSGTQLTQLTPLFESGHIKTHLDATYPLQHAAQAHTHSATGRTRGKIVLTVD